MMGKGWGVALAMAVSCGAGCGGSVNENGRAPSERDGSDSGAGGDDDGTGTGGRHASGGGIVGAGGRIASAGGSGAGGGAGGAPGAGGAFIGNGGVPGVAGGTGAGGAACVSLGFVADPMPWDLYVMFDQSSSMAEMIPGTQTTWWTATSDGVAAFMDDPRSEGHAAGIQYFPLGIAPASCTAPYSTPEVPIARLPGVADAIKASLTAHGPTLFTPTGPALQGAIDHMRTVATPGRAAGVFFVTDGFPTECEPADVAGVAEIARAGFAGTPQIRTFVVALGQGLGNLGQIAEAGGTNDAFLVEGGSVSEQLVDALLSVAQVPFACDLDLPSPPAGQVFDLAQVALTFTSSATGATEWLPRLSNRDECTRPDGAGGWFYDHPVTPTRIHVCSSTCGRLGTGSMRLEMGCRPDID